MSAISHVVKNAGEHSFPSQYRSINLLGFTRKQFESIITKKVIENINRNNFLSDKLYVFRSDMPTVDVPTDISQIISETLDNTFIGWTITLDTSKSFNNGWHKGLLH